ncbi:F-box/kelch-repeat protein At1g57790-like [Coffea eugenioides]|uniref:F-box/kelch-repeat protein At1g57790-like n=1 Tax=Coffea arabica TaxID=13443 RepID=A0A6P6T467_COFAR|nr:F-box/kelch-repeat protein At1g57790-like [Coffea arabica]XP_027072797.1 F-box/kelch-repeat protein At1g57790-like [Coffea arabica]XP_027176580.1 F-box/kelch-repeat protein At1g57790-like [Coffea eugenioides]XP_027176581.1 F-box/kelch-repeat protein At1g57790-like [Coffea eugenioides]
MAGRKRRKLKKLPEESRDKENKPDAQQTWLELPEDLLEMIISRLTLSENIRASVVCKQWLAVAISVRVVNKPPWLMFFPKYGDLVEFYDPLHRTFYTLELPELVGSKVCYSKDGWLLIYKTSTNRLMFVNPYTRELIKLPKLELTYQIVAFSAAPTSSCCIVFTIKHISPTIIAISTCHPRAAEWTTINYRNRLPFVSSIWNKLVFCGGKFYCLSLTGWLGVYDPEKRSWVVHVLPPPKCPENFFVKNWWKSKFMAEHNGEIFVIYTSSEVNPVMYKLDQAIKEWVEVKTLGGLSIFASFLSSHAKIDLLGTMRNSVYFSKVRFYGKHCVSYSLDDNRYYPRKQFYDWGEEDPFGSIWIEPPEDHSSFA